MNNYLKKSILIILLFYNLPIHAQRLWTLTDCIDTAISKNIAIKQGYETSEINKINLAQTRSALLPNLYLNDSHSLNFGFSLDPYTNQYTSQNISSNTLSLNSSVSIFNGHVLLYSIKQNRLLYQAGLLDLDKLKVDITLSVLAAYMQVLMDVESLAVAEQQVLTSSIQVTQTEKFLQFGKVAALSVLQIQAQLAADKLLVIVADNQLQTDKLTLQQLMETPIQQAFELTKHNSADSFITLPPTTDQIATVSYSFMPQIKSASLKTEAFNTSIKVAQTLGIPSLILSGGLKTGYSNVRSNFIYDTSYQLTTIGYVKGDIAQPVTSNVPITTTTKQTQNFSDQFKNNFGQYLTLTLSVPIFNRYQARNSIAIARVNVRTALLNEQLTKNDLRKKIETVYINQITAGLKMMAIKEQLAIEQATYTDMEKKYGFGAVGATDFLIEKNNFNKATMSFIQAKYDYAFKSKMIDFYLNKPLNY